MQKRKSFGKRFANCHFRSDKGVFYIMNSRIYAIVYIHCNELGISCETELAFGLEKKNWIDSFCTNYNARSKKRYKMRYGEGKKPKQSNSIMLLPSHTQQVNHKWCSSRAAIVVILRQEKNENKVYLNVCLNNIQRPNVIELDRSLSAIQLKTEKNKNKQRTAARLQKEHWRNI